MFKKLIATSWVVGLLGTGAVGVYLYLRGEEAEGADKYRTEKVDRGDVTMSVTATGTISAVTTVQVGSQVSGIIARLHADYNSAVKKSQLLAELDPTPFEATVAQNRANLEQAEVTARNSEIQFNRMDRLLQANLVAEADYDAAKADRDAAAARVQQAKAALDLAETNLRHTKILSPISGVVVDRQYDVGQTVAASFHAPTLFTIAQDLRRMQVQADVDQSDIGRIRIGQTARFTVDAYPEEEFQGKITQLRLNATVAQNVVTYPVIIEVPNPESKLRPKMTADVRIELAKVTDVLRIANAALRFRPTEEAGAPGGKRGSGGGARRSGETGAGGSVAVAAGYPAPGRGGRNSGGGAPSADSAGGGPGGGERSGSRGESGEAERGAAPRGDAAKGSGDDSPSAAGADYSGPAGTTGDGSADEGAAVGTTGASEDRPNADPRSASGGGGAPGDGRTETAPRGGAGPRMWGGAAFNSAIRQVEGGVGAGAGRSGLQTVYVLEAKNKLRPVEIRTGISDGRYTEIVSGSLEPGERVVVGLVTAKAEQRAGSPRVGGRIF